MVHIHTRLGLDSKTSWLLFRKDCGLRHALSQYFLEIFQTETLLSEGF